MSSRRLLRASAERSRTRAFATCGYAAPTTLKVGSIVSTAPSSAPSARAIVANRGGSRNAMASPRPLGSVLRSSAMTPWKLRRSSTPSSFMSGPLCELRVFVSASTSALGGASADEPMKPSFEKSRARPSASRFTKWTNRVMRPTRSSTDRTPILPKSRYAKLFSAVTSKLPGCGSAWKNPWSKNCATVHCTPWSTMSRTPSASWLWTHVSSFLPSTHSSVSTFSLLRCGKTFGTTMRLFAPPAPGAQKISAKRCASTASRR
mmetsp:Transcript_11530/g.38526  ORF Transcript_11530/g.38526 Transcript_11530/m.38526 type:complete len:262 (+) Transcript_11530:401-1186(+)